MANKFPHLLPPAPPLLGYHSDLFLLLSPCSHPLLEKSGLLTISWPRHRPTPSHSGALALDTPVSGALSPSDSSGPFLSLPLGLFQMLIFHLLMGGSLSITLFKIALPLCPSGPSPTPYFIFFSKHLSPSDILQLIFILAFSIRMSAS